ncbi:MAG: hypothetical protein PHU14_17135 [Methylovulum sp.]|nr:hypothetical protein [Methylovulum sp.]
MAVEKQLLLVVEGETDEMFFTDLCRQWQLHPHIQVAPPKVIEGKKNSKQGVYNILPMLLEQLNDGNLKRLAVIVDADYQSVNSADGFNNTLSKVTEIVTLYGFALKSDQQSPPCGLIFQHDDGLSDFGLWIMPNNQDEGMLEDFLKTCIYRHEQPYFNHAAQAIAKLPDPKFKTHHNSKAEIATWLAWQKKPGHGLYASVNDDLLDKDNALFQQLGAWLRHIYSSATPTYE